MSFASRHHSSLPPITSLPSDKDGDHEHSTTNPSPGSDTENNSEAEHPTDRESTAPVSGNDTSRATSPGAGLIPNLEFSRVHSWLHVLVPARRVAKLDAVKEFKDYVDEALTSSESWSHQHRSRRKVFMHDKWPVMECYKHGWPLEVMARQVLIDHRSEEKRTQLHKTSRTSKLSKSTKADKLSKHKPASKREKSSKQDRVLRASKSRRREKACQREMSSDTADAHHPRYSTSPVNGSPIPTQFDPPSPPTAGPSTSLSVATASQAYRCETSMGVSIVLVTESSVDECPNDENMHEIAAQDDPPLDRDALEHVFVALLGETACSLVPRFTAAGICTSEAVETFAKWTAHEQHTFMKEDMGLTVYKSMDIVYRIAQRK